jgi:thiol:disulfide interchange protein/DsbC/DsbD-like thiol-disulfide interchange protein
MLAYRRFLALVLQFLVFLPGLALAASASAAPPAAPTHIAARLLAEGPVAPGGTVTLAVEMTPSAGWHGYWKNPGDAGFGTVLKWTLPQGASAGEAAYPVPRTLLIAGLMNHVYEQAYALLVPLKVPAGAAPGAALPVRLAAEWLACTDQICVPERAELTTSVTLAAPGTRTPPDPRFDTWRARLPAPLGSPASFAIEGGKLRVAIPLPASVRLDAPHLFPALDRMAAYAAPQEFRRKGDLLIVTLARPERNAASPGEWGAVLSLDREGNGLDLTARPGPVPTGGEPVSTAAEGAPALSLPALIGAALLGGLLLNVMPCVFPILSLKALSLARSGEGNAAEARAEGLAYTAGVMLACLALGGLLLALRAGGAELGWAFQLQEPGVVAVLLLLAVAITANLVGLYEFTLPAFVGNSAHGNGGGARGAFATGLLAAFVATPCTGPFMATAMGAALLLPPLQAMVLFGALGLGLALPFLAIGLVPPLRALLPRPGGWMNTVRKVLAVPMGLTALALGWLAWRLGGEAFAGAAVALAAVLLVVLAVVGLRQHRGLSARMAGLGAAVLAVVAFAALPGLARAPGAAAPGLLPSQPFSQAALDAALAAKKPVFVYFTADWCLTCKVNEEVAIERPETRDAFARAGVVVLRGDWTRRDPAITRYLSARGAAGVPLYVWYDRAGTIRPLPQLLDLKLLSGLAGG